MWLLDNWNITKLYAFIITQTRLQIILTSASVCSLPGRTHQLRVHCGAIGHAIVGDFTYSSGADDAPYRMMLHAHLLHIPLEPQPLLVSAGDPFIPTVDPKWIPQRSVRTVTATVKALLERRLEEDRKMKEEAEVRARREKEEEMERKNKQRTEEESEEHRRLCHQWLSDWAAE